MNEQRIKAVVPPYQDSVQKDFDTIMPPGMPPLNIFRTVAANPRVLHRMISGGLLDKGSISLQEREIVILRSCARCKAEYEWGVHVAGFSAKAKLSQEQLADTIPDKPNPSLWSARQLILLNLVDQLHGTGSCDDQLWNGLCREFKEDQIIELIMLTGLYHAVSFLVNGLKLTNEPFAPRFPEPHQHQ
jgi:alkylhydroperoxidase family enzyme